MAMKVKDAVSMWLHDMRKLPTVYHYFKDKKVSVCGKLKHPKRQFNAVYVAYKVCKRCEKISGETF